MKDTNIKYEYYAEITAFSASLIGKTIRNSQDQIWMGGHRC